MAVSKTAALDRPQAVGHLASLASVGNDVGVQWAYNLVSTRCGSLQLVATMIRAICSTFQLVAVRCS
jgi:hypothetical protein